MSKNLFYSIASIIGVSVLFVLLKGSELCAGTNSKDVNTNYTESFITWLKVNSNTETGLPFSHVGDERFQYWTITYDSAVVVLAYSTAGKYAEAKKVLELEFT